MLMEAEARTRLEMLDRRGKRTRDLEKKDNPRRKKIIKAGEVEIDIGTGSPITVSFWDQIADILERFDFRKGISGAAVTRREALAFWVTQMQAAGEKVVMPEALLRADFRKPWKALTAGELEAVYDGIDNIEHLARRRVDYMVGQEHLALDTARGEMVSELLANLPVDAKDPPGQKGKWHKAKQDFLALESKMEKMEFLIDHLDGGKPNGAWRRRVWVPFKEAEAKRNRMGEQYTRPFVDMTRELIEGRRREMQEKRRYAELHSPGKSDGEYNRMGLISIALNWGNLSNRKKLLEGYGWNEFEVKRILDQELTEQDWAYVGRVWKLIDGLWPDIVENEKRLSGVAPKRVEAVPVETPFGRLDGGYFPVAYDRDKVEFIERAQAADAFLGQEGGLRSPTTGHNHTYERTEFSAPILLELDVIPAHLSQVIHDLTHRETLLRVHELTKHSEVQAALNATVGKDQAKLFKPWLQAIGNDRTGVVGSLAPAEKALGMVRRNVTAYTLAFRATTLAIQVAGHSNGIAHLRTKLGGDWKRHWANGALESMGSFATLSHVDLYGKISEQSPFMRERIENIDRDMRDIVRRSKLATGRISVPFTKNKDAPIEFGMKLIGRMQLYTVDIPIWLAAYNGAIDVHGLDPEAAVDFADQAVSQSQGSAGTKDLSELQRASEGFKQMSLFSSYTFTVYAQNKSAFRNLRNNPLSPSAYADFMLAAILRLTVPGVIAALFGTVLTGRNRLPEDDDWEDWAQWVVGITAGEFAGTVPVLRDSTGFLVGLIGGTGAKYFQSQLPSQRVLETAKRVAKGRDATEKMLNLLRFGGMLSGKVPDQVFDLAEIAIED